MTKMDLKTFIRALTSRRTELESGSVNRASLTIEASADELDRIQDAGNRDWAMGNLERSSNQLREVRDAFRRIAAGTFGVCVECEGVVSPKRLAAVPWASSCIYCQERADRQQLTTADEFEPSLVAA
jgi:DnaK suppressor protein